MTDIYACGIEAVRPHGDLIAILGLDDSADLWSDLQKIDPTKLSPEEHYAWRALIDPIWGPWYKNNCMSSERLYQAGFFDDGLNKLPNKFKTFDSKFACVPVRKVEINSTRVPNKGLPVVLFTTGGMAPIHNGHVAMMEAAKAIVEASGGEVIGGYFCPGHDSYVGKKYGGTAAIPAAHRCAMIELAIQDSDWLELDPWAARYMPTEVNFTDVYDHLIGYLRAATLIEDLQLFYVFGDDNAGFKMAPIPTICIPRTHESSKAVREGDTSLIDPRVAHYLAHWQDRDESTLPYLIRNEEDLSIQRMINYSDDALDLPKRRIQLQSAIRLGIAQLFQMSGAAHKCHLLPISTQYEKAKEVIGSQKTISLDAFYEGTYQFSSTRIFEVASSQFAPLYRAERPGDRKLQDQALNIDPGDYVLVEDDTVTGQTIMCCKALLGKDVNITSQVILSDFADYPDETYYDVVDLRDFIVGSEHGGLSVEYKGFTGRAPYVLPFVSLRSRAKIPAEMELELSRVIWQSNVRFFKDTDIRLSLAEPAFQQFACLVGWKSTDKMENICQWYADALMEIV